MWSAGRGGQLLFIFPTRVSLTTITLHYYSDSVPGLPRLRFYAVPDDFNARDAPTEGSSTTHEVQRAKLSISPSEVVAWVLVSILTVLFTGLLSVVLLWMFKKRQARDTSTDNSTPKYEMEATLDMKPLQSNRPLTHTSMNQSEGEGPSEGRQIENIIMCASILLCLISTKYYSISCGFCILC